MNNPADDLVTVERQVFDDGEVAVLVVRGRTGVNVVSRELLQQGIAVIDGLAGDERIRCAVLTGATPRAFIGGADLQQLGALDERSAESFIRSVHGMCDVLRRFPVPVIAKLQGYCLGAGLEIAAACDLRIADSTVRCGMPEVRVGLPSVVEAALLPGLIGWGKTRELLYRGHIIDAQEAYRAGLFEHCVEPADLDEAVAQTVRDIVAAGPRAIRLQKKLIREWESLDVEDAVEAGVTALVSAYQTDEPIRYIERFFARRRGGR